MDTEASRLAGDTLRAGRSMWFFRVDVDEDPSEDIAVLPSAALGLRKLLEPPSCLRAALV